MPRRKSTLTSGLAYAYDTNDVITQTLQPSFQEIKKGSIFGFDRPAFKANTVTINDPIKPFDMSTLNRRSGIGNNTILRQNFLAPDPAPRSAYDFELQDKIRRQQEGLTVKLGDKTLSDLFKVVTVDPDDKEWLAEYNRRLGAGETKEQLKNNPPFGRPQRPLTKMVNFAEASSQSALNVSDKLDLISASLTSTSDSAKLADIMLLIDKIDTFTQENYITMTEILRKTNAIPSAPELFFGSSGYHRFWSIDQYRASEPKLMMYILTNSKTGDPTKPIISISGIPITRQELVMVLTPKRDVYDSDGNILSINGNNAYLDINNLRVVDRDFVVNAVNGGADSGQINGELPALDKITGSIRWLTTREEDIVKARLAPRPIPIPPPLPRPPAPKAP